MSSETKRAVDREFQSAASYLSAPEPGNQLNSKTKLEIYGLYKVIVNGPQPSSSRPSIFDQVGRAKWDAWLGAGKAWAGAGGDIMKEAAQLRYLEIARAVGWKEGEPECERGEDDVDLDRLDDDEMPLHSSSSSSGMGTRVSTMTPMRAEVVRAGCVSLHDSAAAGDVAGLERYLASNASYGVDNRNSDACLKRICRSPRLIFLQGYTAMHLASDRGHLEVVKFLVTADADLELKDPDGWTARELAELAGHSDVALQLQASLKQDGRPG